MCLDYLLQSNNPTYCVLTYRHASSIDKVPKLRGLMGLNDTKCVWM